MEGIVGAAVDHARTAAEALLTKVAEEVVVDQGPAAATPLAKLAKFEEMVPGHVRDAAGALLAVAVEWAVVGNVPTAVVAATA